jgi:2-octaprenyl-6-methoxyphenol hydroxylase
MVRFDYDLAIAGGGIVGTLLACALRNSGLRVVLIEARPRTAGLSRRQAYAGTLLSGKIFQGLGLWQEILPKVTTFRQIRLSDADHPNVVRFLPEDLGTEALGYVAEHHVLMRSLYDCLDKSPNITELCPAEVVQAHYQSDGVELQVAIAGETQTIRTRLLVAADGSRSPIRQQAGIRTRGWKYWQSCITCVIQPEKDHGSIAYERFWPSGPFAILPLPENRCQIVWTAPHAEAKAMAALDDESFLAELSRRYGGQMGELSLASDRYVFQVQLMQSDRYTLPRLALVGDAAHCCHPVGGQGLNMGIRDAAALAQVLLQAHQKGEDIGDLRVLRRYERWRKLENLTILGFTDFLDRCFSNNWLPLVVIRRIGLCLMRTLRPFKYLALRLMTGQTGRSPQLARH